MHNLTTLLRSITIGILLLISRMNTYEINDILTKNPITKKIFCGVFAIDNLPKERIKRPCAFVVNTEESTKRGLHWFAIFVPRTGPIEYFDSFGFKPQNKEVYHFIKMNGKQWIHNSRQIQSNESNTCGLFCIIFIALRSKNYNFKQFLRMFKENKLFNENLVGKLFFRFFQQI